MVSLPDGIVNVAKDETIACRIFHTLRTDIDGDELTFDENPHDELKLSLTASKFAPMSPTSHPVWVSLNAFH